MSVAGIVPMHRRSTKALGGQSSRAGLAAMICLSLLTVQCMGQSTRERRAQESGDLARFPSPEVEFIVGPQLRSGSALNIAPWFDKNAIERGIYHGDAFPANPPSSPTDDYDAYLNLNYYDQALCQYNNYYRTGDARFLVYARKTADSWWKSTWVLEGKKNVEDSFAPRNAGLAGLMLRALERPEMWPWITEYTRTMFQIWVGTRVTYPGLHYGVRDGGYMLFHAANLAKVHPDRKVRDEFRQKVLNAAVNYYARLQYPDGSWRWSDPDIKPPLDGFTQPFMVGLLLEGMVQAHRLTNDNRIKQSILKAVENLWSYAYDRRAPWRAMIYWAYKRPATNLPIPLGRQFREETPREFNEVREARQLNTSVHHAFGYAYAVSSDARYREWGDEIFKASFSALDKYRNLADFRAKEYNAAYRSSGRYLAWRLAGSPPAQVAGVAEPDQTKPLPTGRGSLSSVASALTEAVRLASAPGLTAAQVTSLLQRIEEARKMVATERDQLVLSIDVLTELKAASENAHAALRSARVGDGGQEDAKLRVSWAAARLKRAADRMQSRAEQ